MNNGTFAFWVRMPENFLVDTYFYLWYYRIMEVIVLVIFCGTFIIVAYKGSTKKRHHAKPSIKKASTNRKTNSKK